MESKPHTVNAREKNKRIVRNIASYLLNNLTTIAFGFIVPRLFLVNFGSEVNGLVHTVKQILVYLSLLEAGVGAAAQQALYGPVAKNNKDKVNSIVASMHHYYRRTGIVYFVLSISFAFIYPLFLDTGLSYFVVFTVIMLYALPEVLKYLVQGKYRIFLAVEGKTYVINNVNTVMLWVCNILRILMIMFTNNLLLIQATYCLPSIAQIVIILIYIKRNYKWLDIKVKPDLASLKQKNSVLIHQISGVIFNNTDTVIISVICGLKEASVYTVYTLFFTNIDRIIYAFTDGINFRLGQIFHTNRKLFDRLYDTYEELYTMCVFIGYTVVATFLLPIITLYTKGVDDATYIKSIYVILFATTGILASIKYPAIQLIGFSGDFDTTRHHAVIEMILNLGVSIPAAIQWGISGCLIGTVVALTYRGIAMFVFTNKRILQISCIKTFRRIVVNFLIAFGVLYFLGTQSCNPSGYMYVILQAFLNALWIAAVFIVINVLLDFKTFRSLPEFIKRAVRKNEHT